MGPGSGALLPVLITGGPAEYEGRRRPRSSAHDAGSWVTSSWSGAKDDGASAHARDFTTALLCRTRTFVPVTQSDPGRCSAADAGQERSAPACRAAASICPTRTGRASCRESQEDDRGAVEGQKTE